MLLFDQQEEPSPGQVAMITDLAHVCCPWTKSWNCRMAAAAAAAACCGCTTEHQPVAIPMLLCYNLGVMPPL